MKLLHLSGLVVLLLFCCLFLFSNVQGEELKLTEEQRKAMHKIQMEAFLRSKNRPKTDQESQAERMAKMQAHFLKVAQMKHERILKEQTERAEKLQKLMTGKSENNQKDEL